MIAIIVIELNGQVTFANNGVFVNPPDNQTAYTYSNFIVPPGQNRILVIGAMTDDGDINNITYNGIAGLKAVSGDCCGFTPEEKYYTAVWYVLLGSGGQINSDVAFNFNFTPQYIAIGIASFYNVDQSLPISDTDAAGPVENVNFTYNTDALDLVLDHFAGSCNFMMVTPGMEQTTIINGVTSCGISFGMSTASTGTPTTTTSWATNSGIASGIGSGVVLNGIETTIPTLSQWGIIILCLLFLILGTVFLKKRSAVLRRFSR